MFFDGNTINDIFTKKTDKSVDLINTLTTIGVPSFIEYAEQERKSYTFINNTQYKILISVRKNFQLARPILKISLSCLGRRPKKQGVLRSESKTVI